MSGAYLAAAILLEICGTTSLKLSAGSTGTGARDLAEEPEEARVSDVGVGQQAEAGEREGLDHAAAPRIPPMRAEISSTRAAQLSSCMASTRRRAIASER